MSKPILVCDVDGVVVDLSYKWYERLNYLTASSLTYEEVSQHYDYYKPFTEFITKEDAHSFWKQSNLYNEAVPLTGAVEFIAEFKKQGWDVVFASHTEGSHAKSKYDFLERHFEFDGFMATREKHFLRANIAIDDRAEHLVRHGGSTLRVLKALPHNMENWEEFVCVFNLSEKVARALIGSYLSTTL